MIKRIFIHSVFLLFVLTGCSINRATETSTPTSTDNSNQVSTAYPLLPEQNSQAITAYPANSDVPSALESGKQPVVTVKMPIPEPGKGSLTGALFSYTQKRIVPKTLFYLTPGFGEEKIVPLVLNGPTKEYGDISGFSDESGNISLTNVPPGIYYLIVMAPYNWSIAETADLNQIPLKIIVEADQKLELGILNLSWP